MTNNPEYAAFEEAFDQELNKIEITEGELALLQDHAVGAFLSDYPPLPYDVILNLLSDLQEGKTVEIYIDEEDEEEENTENNEKDSKENKESDEEDEDEELGRISVWEPFEDTDYGSIKTMIEEELSSLIRLLKSIKLLNKIQS